MYKEIQVSENEWIVSFNKGSDLLESLNAFVTDKGISTGIFQGIGAVSMSKFGFYDQDASKYLEMQLDEHAEILNCSGNVTLKEDKPFVHAHITLAGKDGSAYGGHLIRARVFAGEFYFKKFDKEVKRNLDDKTKLYLI